MDSTQLETDIRQAVRKLAYLASLYSKHKENFATRQTLIREYDSAKEAVNHAVDYFNDGDFDLAQRWFESVAPKLIKLDADFRQTAESGDGAPTTVIPRATDFDPDPRSNHPEATSTTDRSRQPLLDRSRTPSRTGVRAKLGEAHRRMRTPAPQTDDRK